MDPEIHDRDAHAASIGGAARSRAARPEIEAKTGRKPGKKHAKELREEVVRELLPKAFTRQAAITVWIDP